MKRYDKVYTMLLAYLILSLNQNYINKIKLPACKIFFLHRLYIETRHF